MIEAKNIQKVYSVGKRKLQVLSDIDLKINNGEFVAVVGPSGAGKSTLLHILGGLDSPTTGRVFFEGEDIYSLSDRQISRLRNTKFGFVFQFYHLLPDFTVLENVLFPVLINPEVKIDKADLVHKAKETLKDVGLINRITHFPGQLSGGEKQRVAIVRALINKPDLLLCDEPTGNLDSKSGEEVFSLISDISKKNNMTVVMVTHNVELAKQADKIYHLKDGLLVS